VPDAGGLDAGAADAGTPDAGTPDAGLSRPAFLIGGQDQRHLVSFDARSWQHDVWIAPSGLDDAFYGGAIGAGVLLLAGDPGLVRSTDGSTWQSVSLPPASLHGAKLVYAAGLFVMVSQGDAYRSADGLAWEHAADTGYAGHWQQLVYGAGHWLALGDGHRKRSEDGLSWHDYNATEDANPLASVAFGNGVFVAVGGVNKMARVTTSTDALSWHEQAPVPTSYETGFGSVAFGAGRFLASDCCNAFESTDGVSWRKRGEGMNGTIVFGGGQFIGVGWRTEAALYEPDAGAFVSTLQGDRPTPFEDGGIAPWFTAVAAGDLGR
jgi:hypothetical protein